MIQTVPQKRRPTNCIQHVAAGIEHGDFTPLCKVRRTVVEKLSQLHDVRDRLLLIEPLNRTIHLIP